MKNIVIIGASGHGKVVADILLKSGHHVVGFLDDAPDKRKVWDIPVIGKINESSKFKQNYFIIAIGNNEIRRQIAQDYLELNYCTAIHPSASIGKGVTIGKGTVIMASAVINADTQIGNHCIINTAAVIEHDNSIGDYTHVSPNATLAGTVKIGSGCHIGAGATVINNLMIGDEVVIGAGSVVVQDRLKKGTYVGVPVRKVYAKEDSHFSK